jgi:hypothetical protein
LVLGGCGGDDSTGPDGNGEATIPASWAGIWSVQTTSVDCSTMEVGEDTVVDTLCAGQPFQFELPFGNGVLVIPCSGTIGETAFDLDCGSTLSIGCAVDVHITLDGTRDAAAHTFTGTGRFDGIPGPECPPEATAVCLDITINGTRLSSDSPGCPASAPRAVSVGRQTEHWRRFSP